MTFISIGISPDRQAIVHNFFYAINVLKIKKPDVSFVRLPPYISPTNHFLYYFCSSMKRRMNSKSYQFEAEIKKFPI